MKMIKFLVVSMIMITVMSCGTQTNKNEQGESMNYQGIEIPPISVQLWSIKNELKDDFKGTLKEVSAMGFKGVEFARHFGPYKDDAKGLLHFLDGLGLQVSAAHIGFEDFNDENFDKSVAFYKALKTEILIIPWDDRAWDSSKIDNLVADLNALHKKLRAEGLYLGYHNHEREFEDYKGETFWDYLAKSTPKDFVLQLDVGWVIYAEKDPVAFINRYPNRILTTHIKAKLPEGTYEGKREIIGDDVTDWDGVLKADMTVGGTKWFVVEQEDYPDGLTPLQAVKLSKQGLDKIISNL